MIDKNDAQKLAQELSTASESKIEVQKIGREVIKTSKKLIYSLHRGEIIEAGKLIIAIEGERQKLDKIAKDQKLRVYGPYKGALSEYVEAVTFYFYLKENRIPSSEELEVDAETYLMGLSDLTGEMMRKAVNDMAKSKYETALTIRDTVDEIHGLMLSLDFDGGEARRKSDQVKWNLNKIEGLVYDAKIRDKI